MSFHPLVQSNPLLFALWLPGRECAALVDESGAILDANDALLGFLATSRDKLRGRLFDDITAPSDVAADRTLFTELREGLRQLYELEKRYRPDVGPYVAGKLRATRFEHEGAWLYLGLVMPVDSHVRALDDEEAKDRLLREAIGDMVMANRQWIVRIALALAALVLTSAGLGKVLDVLLAQ